MAMILFAAMFLGGAVLGALLRYVFLIIAVLSYCVLSLIGYFAMADGFGFWGFVIGGVALQLGYLAGALIPSRSPKKRTGRH